MLHWFMNFFRRRPEYRRAPPLKNAHYIGLHIANAGGRSALR
ncbi:MAG TPA: hypothetical protein VF226_01670 [Hyphomicrobiaceae bacterium]